MRPDTRRSSSLFYCNLPSLALRVVAATMLASMLAGCAPSALSAARSQIAAGNYAAAHHELVALSARENTLSASERREVKDDLCLSDFMLGKPAFTLSEQRSVCVAAMKEPGSQSASIISKIDDAARAKYAKEVETALEEHDLARAERAATNYQRLAGADPELIARWSKKI